MKFSLTTNPLGDHVIMTGNEPWGFLSRHCYGWEQAAELTRQLNMAQFPNFIGIEHGGKNQLSAFSHQCLPLMVFIANDSNMAECARMQPTGDLFWLGPVDTGTDALKRLAAVSSDQERPLVEALIKCGQES